jgi:hypothetical protein
MLKLKNVICQLNSDDMEALEADLTRAKAEKFHLLLKEYRNNLLSDKEIMEMLDMNKNTFYVLKSRLNDKIQDYLTGGKEFDKQEIIKQLAGISRYCYETPRETAVSILLKLEKDLQAYDLSADLTVVYSTLKKLHVNSPKYYFYSQLYNKHVAYFIALEKAEDLLGDFSRTLSLYYFSRSKTQKEMLLLIRNELKNIHALNKAHHVEFIKNLVTIQLSLFCDVNFPEEEALEDIFKNCSEIIDAFPNDSHYKYYRHIIDFLQFEYYMKIAQEKKASLYFERVDAVRQNWLLYSNCCLANKFLLTRINYFARLNLEHTLAESNNEVELIYDKGDLNTEVVLKLYCAVSFYYSGKTKKAISVLNEALNVLSTKEGMHMEMELKLFLAYLYYTEQEAEAAANSLRSIYRKINASGTDEYEHVLLFQKIIDMLISSKDKDAKLAKTLRMFVLLNVGEKKVLAFLEPEIEKLKLKFSIA